MKIGIFGLWGMNIPGVAFGGFETVYSRISTDLVSKGYDVVIYCRKERYPKGSRLNEYKKVRLKYVPSIDTKNLSAVTSTWVALLDSLLREKFDIYLFVNPGMGFQALAAKLLGKKVVLNVDGLDWERGKWNSLAKLYFRTGARLAVLGANELIADSVAIQSYYSKNMGRQPAYITYGANIIDNFDAEILKEYGVESRNYFLIVSRFVPENNLHILIKAYNKASVDAKLLVVGGTNHPMDYETELRTYESEKIIFTGYIKNRNELDALLGNAYAYLHGQSVGGTSPALLDAMGCGSCILAVNTPYNVEVLDGNHYGMFFNPMVDDAQKTIEDIWEQPGYAQKLREKSRERILKKYNWKNIVDEYEQLFLGIMQ